MHDRHRRIKKLEQRVSKKRPPQSTHPAVDGALKRLSNEHMELFLTRFPEELGHRNPTDAEAAARDAYRAAIKQECERQEAERAKPPDPSSDMRGDSPRPGSPPTAAG